MTAHELAKRLLELPDKEVKIGKDEGLGYCGCYTTYTIQAGSPWIDAVGDVCIQIENPDVAVIEIIKKLRRWAYEEHDLVCQGLSQCRHERAKQAITEINNAVAACQKDHKDVEGKTRVANKSSHE